MLFRWLKNRKRRGILDQPFPEAWLEVVRRDVLAYNFLSAEEQEKVLAYLRVFVAEKNWEGCGGLAMNAEIQVTIAAQVAILVLGFSEAQYFDHVLSILVYPTAYVAPGQSITRGGIVVEGSPRLGEAWYRGPVVFSWGDVQAAGRQTTRGNVVYHEFAHQLDMLNGSSVDGLPPMTSDSLARRWGPVMGEHYRQLVHACSHRQPTLIDCYGATSPAEFFAVATETFFTESDGLKQHFSPLYEVLAEFYQQDPASRAAP